MSFFGKCGYHYQKGQERASCVSHGSIKRISFLCNAYAAAGCALSSSHPTIRAFRFPCSACAAVGCALPCCIRLPITIAALQCMIFFSIGLLVLIGLCFFYRLETSAPGLSGYYWYTSGSLRNQCLSNMVLDGYMLPRSMNEARPSRMQGLCLLQALDEPMPRNYGPKGQVLEAWAILQQSFPIGRVMICSCRNINQGIHTLVIHRRIPPI